jgi:hypothetical protein
VTIGEPEHAGMIAHPRILFIHHVQFYASGGGKASKPR